jgi:hypothetical protein
MTLAKASSKSAFYQGVDDAFYTEVKRENGGKLPPNLTGEDGKPRKLTNSPQDRVFRQKWNALAAHMRHSKAVPKKPVKSACAPCAAAQSMAAKPVVLPGKGGKPVKAGSVRVGQAAPAAAAPAKAPAAAPAGPTAKGVPCKNETVAVTCSHAARNYQLQLPGPDGSASAEFDVLDDGHENVTCTTKTVAVCDTHNGKVFDINPEDSALNKTNTQLKFQALHDPSLRLSSFSDLFTFGKARTPQVYQVSTETCQQEGPLSVTVNCYPQVDWKVDFSLNYSKPSSGDGDAEAGDNSGGGGEDSQAGWSLIGAGGLPVPTVSVTVLGQERTFGQEIIDDLQEILGFLDLSCKILDFFAGVEKDLGDKPVKMTYPQLSFSGSWGWDEIPESPSCGYKLSLDVKASPLIGAAATIDVLGLVIDAIPAVGQAINFIRGLVKSIIDFEINLEIDGTIGGEFSFTEQLGASPNASGELQGAVSFNAESLARVGGTVSVPTLSVSWSGVKIGTATVGLGTGAELGATGGIHVDVGAGYEDNGFYWQGEVSFDGLDIYAATAGIAGVETGSPPPEDNASGEDSDTTVEGKIDTSDLPGQVGYEHVWHWLKPCQIWGSGERHPLFAS